jgi:F0F1-type ATP synthase membrane subunit a
LLSQAQGDYQNLLQSTDAWFNRQMDRVAGWCRRKTQYMVIAIAIAIVIVALLGVDTIKIVSRLYVASSAPWARARTSRALSLRLSWYRWARHFGSISLHSL